MNSHIDLTVQPAPVAATRLALTPDHGLFMNPRRVDALEAPGPN